MTTRRVHAGRVFNLRVDEVEGSDGRRRVREVIEHPGAVVVVPLDGIGNVILVRQPRYAARETLLELPAGTLDHAGETLEEAARRELREETGYEAAEMSLVGGFYSAPGFCTEYLHLFVARGLHFVGAAPEEDEEISVVPTRVSEVAELVRRGEIKDAKSIAGLLRTIYVEGMR